MSNPRNVNPQPPNLSLETAQKELEKIQENMQSKKAGYDLQINQAGEKKDKAESNLKLIADRQAELDKQVEQAKENYKTAFDKYIQVSV